MTLTALRDQTGGAVAVPVAPAPGQHTLVQLRQISGHISRGGPNLCLQSQTLDVTPWGNNAVTVTANTTVAPDGTTTADTVTRTSGPADSLAQTITFTGDGTKSASLFLRQGTSAAIDVALFDVTAGAWRNRVRFTWTNGVPVLSTIFGAGALSAVQALPNGWFRTGFAANAVIAANTNQLYIYPSPLGANGDTVTVWGVQVENSAAATAYVATTTTVFGG